MSASWIQMLVNMAPPQAGAGGEQNPYSGLIMLAIMFAIFYFLLIRPQQKRAKEQQSMVDALKKGDDVVTAGGIFGKITGVADDIITLQVADNVRIRVQKSAVQHVISSGAAAESKGE